MRSDWTPPSWSSNAAVHVGADVMLAYVADSPHRLYTARHTTKELGLEELRRIREQAGFTQVSLAKVSGVDRATINKIEQGHRSPTLETLAKLARAMGAEVADFFPKGQPPLLDPGEERRLDRTAALGWALERAADNGEKVVQAWKAGGEYDFLGWMKDDTEADILLREWGAAVADDPELRATELRLAGVRKTINNLANQVMHARPAESHMIERFREQYARSTQPPARAGNPANARAKGA
jgi:transcriptional regulator with XRE-family HTH domain